MEPSAGAGFAASFSTAEGDAMSAPLTPPPAAAQLESSTYTVPQVAKLLQCSERHVWRLADADAIPGKLRIGRLVRFARSVIDAWIAAGCKPVRQAGRAGR
jgi:excisionase family DNA binding protein